MNKYVEVTHDDGTTEQVSKLQRIKEVLQDFIAGIANEKAANEERKKPLNIDFGTRIHNRLALVLQMLETPLIKADGLKMSAEELNECYIQYCELCCWIEDSIKSAFIQNKPEFCSFAAITTATFEEFKDLGDYHQREVVCDIEDKIANGFAVAAENSDIKSNAAWERLHAKSSIGHRIQSTTAKEPVVTIPVTANSFTPLSELIMPVLPKQLSGGK